jgi:hypothetical protein
LCREKEFNAEHRRVNAEYLVNVLRNFLMSTDPSERSRLVLVLCQILHFKPEDTKFISEKWAVRSGGLVGWLLPQRPGNSYGMMDKARSSNDPSKSLDVTYDPATGGGIDINSY